VRELRLGGVRERDVGDVRVRDLELVFGGELYKCYIGQVRGWEIQRGEVGVELHVRDGREGVLDEDERVVRVSHRDRGERCGDDAAVYTEREYFGGVRDIVRCVGANELD